MIQKLQDIIDNEEKQHDTGWTVQNKTRTTQQLNQKFDILKQGRTNCFFFMSLHQFLFAGTQMRDDIASEAYEDELDMGRSGSYLNSSITSAWSEHSLDPEDIRVGIVSLNLSFSIV